MNKKSLAIVGATGIVGRKVLEILEEEEIIFDNYYLFASKKSAGKNIFFKNKLYEVKELNEKSFDDKIDYAIFVAGTEASKKYIPIANSKGCVVIDNSSFFRMNKDVPLIVPEININCIRKKDKLIANPNCSTIQAVIALAPLNKRYKIKRIVYSTYQAVSGAGKYGIEDFTNGINNYYLKGYEYNLKKFKYPIFNNCIPQIDVFEKDGYTKEEYKLINETRKILNNDRIKITATCVRVPVLNSHCESINVEFEESFEINEVKDILRKTKNVVVIDENEEYPIPTIANETNNVYVGRIRKDYSNLNSLNLWVVADNLRRGAAYNAVEILKNIL